MQNLLFSSAIYDWNEAPARKTRKKDGIYSFIPVLLYLPSMCMSREISIIHKEYTVLCSELRNVIFFRILVTLACVPSDQPHVQTDKPNKGDRNILKSWNSICGIRFSSNHLIESFKSRLNPLQRQCFVFLDMYSSSYWSDVIG